MIDDVSAEDFRKLVDLNVTSCFLVSKVCFRCNVTRAIQHGEETAQSEPLAPLMESCVGLSGFVRRCIISAEIAERTAYVFHLLSKFVLIVCFSEKIRMWY